MSMYSERCDEVARLIWERRLEQGWSTWKAGLLDYSEEEERWALDELVQRDVRRVEFLTDLQGDR